MYYYIIYNVNKVYKFAYVCVNICVDMSEFAWVNYTNRCFII